MNKYLVFLRKTPGKEEPPKPDEMKEMYQSFESWTQKYKANIFDMGGRLKAGGKVKRTSGVTDGPFAEAKEVVAGFMIISADTIDEALTVASECPGVMRPGASVEVREIATQ